ncbi:MAG: CBS domain-containing protein [Chloroflexi bacterium]|nr:CBS domain-containing protein [Chloroflexota bacterium]
MILEGLWLPAVDWLGSFAGTSGQIKESLLALGILIIAAKLAEGLFRRLRLNAIIAYAAVGILLGPALNSLGIWHVQATGHIELLLTLGVFIFFFLIGLDEIDISSFVQSLRGHYFLAAMLSVLFSLGISMVVTTGAIYDFGIDLGLTEALALAGILSMTSLGIVAKVLSDEGRLRDPIGLQIFTVVVISELITLLLIGFSIGDHVQEISPVGILVLLGKVAGFAAASWVLSSRVLPPLVALLQRVIQVPQLSLGLLLGVLFLVVDAAELVGLHGTLGALLFGASLAGLPYQVRREIMPGLRSTAEGLFVPLFFASAGLHFTFSFVELPAWTMLALALIPLFGNFIGAFIGAYVSRLTVPYAVASGLMGKGVAEIALLLVLRESGIISEAIFSFLVLVMFCYILFMPSAISFAVNRASRKVAPTTNLRNIPSGAVLFALDDVTVDDILDRTRRLPGVSVSVREFTERWAIPQQYDYVVVDGDALAGIVSMGAFRYLPKSDWPSAMLGDMVRKETPVAYPDEPVEDVLQRMTEEGISAIPVMDKETERVLGSVRVGDVVELMLSEGRG